MKPARNESTAMAIKKQVADHLGKVAALRPAVVDVDQASAYLSLSVSTIENMERKGDFPKKRLLSGRRVGYLLREVDEWLEGRPESDQPPPVNSQFGRAGKPA